MRVQSAIAHHSRSRAVGLTFILGMALGSEACHEHPPANPITFAKVADQNTAIPGGMANETFTGFLTDFSYGPSNSGGDIAFNGNGASGRKGIYVSSGGELKMIADTATLVPGKAVPFTFFDQVSLSAGSVAFVAAYGADEPTPLMAVANTALFSDFGGTLHIVADTSTPIPNGTGNFAGFFGAAMDQGDIAFNGFDGAGQDGAYLAHSDGTIEEIAPTNRPVTATRSCDIPVMVPDCQGPITISFFAKSKPKPPKKLTDRQVVFCAKDINLKKGIYLWTSGMQIPLAIIADTNTLIPGGNGAFTDFGVLEGADNGHIAFIGFGTNNQAGIYYYADGKLSVTADAQGNNGPFTHFSSLNGVSVLNDAVAFFGAGDNQQGGIYMRKQGQLTPVMTIGSSLNGQKIEVVQPMPPIDDWWDYIPPLTLHSEALDGDTLAFQVQFPSSSGIYVAKIPMLNSAQ
jgi:hypothetical protein